MERYRFHPDGAVYFVTFSIVDWLPVFVSEAACKIVTESLDFCASNMPRCFSETFRAAAGTDRERRFWQPTRHPEQIETEQFWQAKLDYQHANPVRKGLVPRAEYWRFSS